MKEFVEKASVIEKGFAEYSKIRLEEMVGSKVGEILPKDFGRNLHVFDPSKDPKEIVLPIVNEISKNIQQQINNIASENLVAKKTVSENSDPEFSSVKEKIEKVSKNSTNIPKIILSDKDKKLLKKLEEEHEKKLKSGLVEQELSDDEISDEEDITAKSEKPLLSTTEKPPDSVSTVITSLT